MSAIDASTVFVDNEKVDKAAVRALFDTIREEITELQNWKRDRELEEDMAFDKLGVLGGTTTATAGTHTVYTCTASRAAVGQILYRGVAGSGSTLKFTVNGIDLFQTGSLTTGQVVYSTAEKMYNVAAANSGVDGTTDAKTVAPGPVKVHLQEGDTVTYTIGTTDFSSINVQFVGGEKINA